MDDTFVINKAEHSQDLLQHINSQDPHIQFTVEPTQHGSLPFLDTLVTIQPDNTFNTTVYRKPTHTQTNTSTGTVTTTSLPNKVFTIPYPTEPKHYLQHRTISKRNSHTSKQPSTTASSPLGPSSNGSTSSTTHNLPQPKTTAATTTTAHPTATNTKQP